LLSIQRQENISPEKEAFDDDMDDSPPKEEEPTYIDLFQGIVERAREILH